MQEFNITFFEACELLNRSRKSVSRYIRRGLLHPKEIKSANGTLEYRFSRDDLLHFKDHPGQEETGQEEPEFIEPPKLEVRQDKTPQPETGQDGTIVPFLMEQIKVKDKQIETQAGQISGLIERDRESNSLINDLQRRVIALDPGKEDLPSNQT